MKVDMMIVDNVCLFTWFNISKMDYKIEEMIIHSNRFSFFTLDCDYERCMDAGKTCMKRASGYQCACLKIPASEDDWDNEICSGKLQRKRCFIFRCFEMWVNLQQTSF